MIKSNITYKSKLRVIVAPDETGKLRVVAHERTTVKTIWRVDATPYRCDD